MPKHGKKSKRSQAGFSVVEAAISSFLVAISISGLVVSTTYGQSLGKSTSTMWRATGAATATLEKIRSDSASRWSTLQTDWNQQSGASSGLADSISTKLTATVTSDATQLDRPSGMWTAGATEPNFFFVEVTPGITGGSLSRSLLFQTYVANREGLVGIPGTMPSDESGGDVGGGSMGGITGEVNSGHGAGGSNGGGDGGGNGGSNDVGSSASQVFPNASNIALSGLLSNKLTFDLVNASSKYLPIVSLKVTGGQGTKLASVSMGNTVVVDLGSKLNAHLTANNLASLVPAGMPPGPSTFSVTAGLASLTGQAVTIELTFADKSTTTVTVKP